MIITKSFSCKLIILKRVAKTVHEEFSTGTLNELHSIIVHQLGKLEEHYRLLQRSPRSYSFNRIFMDKKDVFISSIELNLFYILLNSRFESWFMVNAVLKQLFNP